MDSRRVLITGLSSRTGGRLAQALECDPRVEAIVGVDSSDPRHELERTEFVRVDTRHSVLSRVLRAAAIDTVIDTRLVVDRIDVVPRRAKEVNVAGTHGVLEACADSGSPVRKLVFQSSALWYGHESDDPAFFSEEMRRKHPPRTENEREVVAAEQAVAAFQARNSGTGVTVIRAASVVGAGMRSSQMALLSLPVVPAMLGFDPRCQFIHEDDLIGALVHATRYRIPGTYNAAADGVLALSEIASLLGKPIAPVLPPWGTVFAARQLRRLGLPIPVQLLRELRLGQGLENRRLKSTGYAYRYTTREALLALRAEQRTRALLGGGTDPYRYEPGVEEFLRRSASVQSARRSRPGFDTDTEPTRAQADDGRRGGSAYDDLGADEVIGLAASLDTPALMELRGYEATHESRAPVLEAIDRGLARRRLSDAAP